MKKARVFKRIDNPDLIMPWQAEVPGLELSIRFHTQEKAFEFADDYMRSRFEKAVS